jgi:hypothetical protein
VWACGAELDRRLAEGAAPACSPELELRAQQLRSPRRRRALATGLLRTVDAAAWPPRPMSPVVPLAARAEVLEAAGSLVALAREVRSERPPRVRGLALVSWLLCDAGSPLHTRHARVELKDVVARARAAL